MTVATASQWCRLGLQMSDPESLFKNIWYEGELSCLFADTNLGKSILAMQIAEEISRKQPVLYCDFELSAKQFQERYTDNQGNIYPFSDNLLRSNLNMDAYQGGDFEQFIFDSIVSYHMVTGVKVIIIDNITWLCNAAEKGVEAGSMMMALCDLKKRYSLSILVIAHTPKRDMATPITQNALAGSKRIINFLDSAFAIGKSARDENLRYIKQVKVRRGGFIYDSEHVLLCEIEKGDDGFTRFVEIGEAVEADHLPAKKPDIDKRNAQIRELSKAGKNIREIAAYMRLGKSTVHRVLHSKDKEVSQKE